MTPLPYRDGLAPLKLCLPHGNGASTVVQYLLTYSDDPWLEMIAKGEVVDEKYRQVTLKTSYKPGQLIYFYRTPKPEVLVPFNYQILYQDDYIVVIDKPHFLATIPRGRHVTETATVRLRRDLGCDQLTPAHRLDRLTAGVLLFTIGQELRRPYQELFSSRRVHKVYEALAGFDSRLSLPRVVRSRICKEHGVMTAYEEPGEPNSETFIDLIEVSGSTAKYRLEPKTGKTHQLRIHLASLGIPICGDPFYPEYRSVPADVFHNPLQLLAKSMTFIDPISGIQRHFESNRQLG
ncbi:MAG: pseudouridine synthase [Mycobacteriaceae bacterium]